MRFSLQTNESIDISSLDTATMDYTINTTTGKISKSPFAQLKHIGRGPKNFLIFETYGMLNLDNNVFDTAFILASAFRIARKISRKITKIYELIECCM